ncbi:hypothetical protein FE257_009347 [Aspergillus nanangensis]|uniref:ABC transporter domain-containing protein n=1 Tax=Aspergillus nanangensis TaxID=2582783 RepID=A0AAD4CKR0_ASPNN|nr:hypothetical protein FE257_009347 [Aspergillus nanangensis]
MPLSLAPAPTRQTPEPILTLNKCLLRPYSEDDVVDIAREGNNPKIAQWMTNRYPNPYGLDDAKKWVSTVLSQPRPYCFAICLPGENVAIGGIGLKPQEDVGYRTMELGYWLGEDHWRKGIATEALIAFSRWTFEHFERTRTHSALGTPLTEEDIVRSLTRRRSAGSGISEDGEDVAQVARLISRMFGQERKAHSNEEQTRHLGVVWKNLTVKGVGLGAALQMTNSDLLLGIPRMIKGFLTRGRSKPQLRTILDDFTGCVRPGEMLLVLGRPGSGCSTFLKVIGNQRSGYKSVDGDVRYGGTDSETMAEKYRSEVLYNPEDDLHYATLTVRDTLLFALKTRTPDKESRLPGETRKEYQETFLSAIAKLFWIEHALGTRIGNELIRGVSGGEKKRVSIGEALVTKASTQCWDNSTRGLDASTALEYVQSLRSLTDMANASTLVALYQASENLYNLFDKVILIEEGKCAYYGPTANAKAYFERLGFECPPRWTTPDFLTSVSDPHARRVKKGWEDRIPRSATEFQSIYSKSDIQKEVKADIEDFEQDLDSQEEEREAARQLAPKKNYTVPFYHQVLILTQRQFKIMYGDRVTLIGKWSLLVFQALIIGSLFYNLPPTSAGVFTRGGVLFFVLLFNALLALAELTSFFDCQPIILKHKSFSFYRPSAFALAQVVVDIPIIFVQVTLFELIVYLAFLEARTALIVYFKQPELLELQFKLLSYIQCEQQSIVPQGPNAEPGHQTCALQGSTPDQITVQGANYIESAFTYRRSHLWRNFGIIIAWFIFFVIMTMVGMEFQRPNKGGSSVTIFKRGEAPESVEKALEKQKPPEDMESGKKENGSSTEFDRNGSDEPEEGVGDIAKSTSIFTWKDINYTIPAGGGKKKLLHDVQGYVKPGRLTALMGASGAGKTTLLNTLAQRIDFGVVTGTCLVDGKPLPRSFQRATGFAEQMDIHEPTATVRESLRFSALLRQPQEVPIQEKYDYCEKIIDLLEMRPIAGATVGSGGVGLNQEQRKRLTIAVELASKPQLLLFLDEPTSGLDSLAAFNIVRFLRRLANAGQAILCTIHQPSAVLFEQFDDLLLLQAGGQVVYNGELGSDSNKLINYFEGKGGKTCPPHANPAEYMLEVIGAGNPDYKGQNWADVWSNSPEHKQMSDEIDNIIETRREKTDTKNADDDREFAMPVVVQVWSVSKRAFVAYWRNPQYTLGKFLLHIFTGLFNTFTFWHLGNSYIDMQSRLFSIFMTLTIAPPLIQQLQPQFLHFRNLYESREAKAKIYSWVAFVTSAILPELPYSIVAGSIYFNCWYWGIWFPRDSFRSGFIWMFVMLYELFYVGFGQFIAAFSPNVLFASLLVPTFFTFVISFCGVVVPYSALIHFWRSWMYWLTPFKYLLEGLLGVVIHEVPVKCLGREMSSFSPPPGSNCEDYAGSFARQMGGYVEDAGNGLCSFCQVSNGDNFGKSFNVFYSHKWRDYGIFWAYCIFNFIAVYAFSWLYLHGIGDMKRWFSARKTNKAEKQKL